MEWRNPFLKENRKLTLTAVLNKSEYYINQLPAKCRNGWGQSKNCRLFDFCYNQKGQDGVKKDRKQLQKHRRKENFDMINPIDSETQNSSVVNVQPQVKSDFDIAAYTRDQIVEALTCPINRHATRTKHKCNDFELYKHPEWLIDHYIKCGGAVEFAKRRNEYTNPCKFTDHCRFYTNCKLALTISGFANCPLRYMSERCRTSCNFENCPNTKEDN